MPQVLKEDIKEKILANALTEFMNRGYDNTSMKSIAGKCKIAVGNIYRYFRNKEELYDAIAAPVYDSINRLFEKPPEEFSMEGIEKRIALFIDIYKDNKTVFMMLLKNSDNTRFSDMNNIIIANFAGAISRWREKMTGEKNNADKKAFITAVSTAYLNGIISILSDHEEESIITKRLFEFLFFMKDGLFAKYKDAADHPSAVQSSVGLLDESV